MRLQPVNDNIIIKLPKEEKENKTKSGIVLVSNSNQTQKPNQAIVIAVGEGRITSSGSIVPLTAQIGDKVIFNQFAGTNLDIGDGERYLIIKETDILVILKEN